MAFGTGDFKYEHVEGWAKIPENFDLAEVVAVDTDSNDRVFVFNRGRDPMVIFEPTGVMADAWGSGLFTKPHGVWVGQDNMVYTADDPDQTVRKFTPSGRMELEIGLRGSGSDTGCTDRDYVTIKRQAGPFNLPTGVVVTEEGDIFVSDGYCNSRVHRFSRDGVLVHSWGEPGAEPGEFRVPHNLTIDRSRRLLVADRENCRVQLFSTEGAFLGQWGTFRRPCAISVAGDGRIAVGELGHLAGMMPGSIPATGPSDKARVSIVDGDGAVLQTLGEAGSAHSEHLIAVHSVAFDSQGSLYVGQVIAALFRGVAVSEHARMIGSQCESNTAG